ncbi:MAG: cell division protein FtsQ [Clostridiales bacterium]|nr:cell division protein FtsQ [Clostridiales bacterium]
MKQQNNRPPAARAARPKGQATSASSGITPQTPRPPLTKAQKKAKEKAIRERIKQKRKAAKEEQKKQAQLDKRRVQMAKQKHGRTAAGQAQQGRQIPRRITHTEARRRRRRRTIITAVVLLAFIITGVVLSVTVLFKIDSYKVEGDSIYTQEQLIDAFGHPVGENIFHFRMVTAEQQMEQKLPYLETIKVRRRLPGTVVFIVTPATEAYYIDTDNGALLLSSGLKVLNTAGQAAEGLCKLTGITAASPAAGSQFTTGTPDTDSMVQAVLNAIAASEFNSVVSVDFTDPYELSLVYAGRITVKLGAATQLEYKLEVAKKSLEDAYFTDTTSGVLDASDAGRAVFKPGG